MLPKLRKRRQKGRKKSDKLKKHKQIFKCYTNNFLRESKGNYLIQSLPCVVTEAER